MKRGGLTRSQTSSALQDSARIKRRPGRPPLHVRGIRRAEFLQQHEQVVSELLEEDVERGLKLKSPNKPVNEKSVLNLNEGKHTNAKKFNLLK